MVNPEFSAGIFPGLLEPAKKAAEQLKAEGLPEIGIEGRDGLSVAKKDDIKDVKIHFVFEHNGEEYVIFEEDPVREE